MSKPKIVIAAANSGAGKTTVTAGLIYAMHNKNVVVQAFKAGPDYIDPGFHTLASRRPCRNLDVVMMGEAGVVESFTRASKGADLCVVEGVMGLYDGITGKDEQGSTAQLAKVLRAPVLLCIDISAMARSAGALALGFLRYDPDVNIAGFILNNVAGDAHYEMAKEAVEIATNLPVLGRMPKSKDISLPERHLGLSPAWEYQETPKEIRKAAEMVEKYCDVDAVIAVAKTASDLEKSGESRFDDESGFFGKKILSIKNSLKKEEIKIGYALDDAFHFYYEDNLDMLKDLGAVLIPFSPIRDKGLPRGIKGMYFGGGYPELFAEKLSGNTVMRGEVKNAAEMGMPCYGECGGLMYLVKKLVDFDGDVHEMTGLFPETVRMTKKLAALGYYRGRALKDCVIADKGWEVTGHVFHWSELEVPAAAGGEDLAFSLTSSGGQEVYDGLVKKNSLAGYFHIHFAGNPDMALKFVRNCAYYDR